MSIIQRTRQTLLIVQTFWRKPNEIKNPRDRVLLREIGFAAKKPSLLQLISVRKAYLRSSKTYKIWALKAI